MLTPGTDFDSMRATPGDWLIQRSMRFVIVFSTDAAGIPGKNVMTCTAGVLNAGRMSTGTWNSDQMPRKTMKKTRAPTMYGFLSDALMSHIVGYRDGRQGAGTCAGKKHLTASDGGMASAANPRRVVR